MGAAVSSMAGAADVGSGGMGQDWPPLAPLHGCQGQICPQAKTPV